jgi:cytoskeletal protein CcmA (bactofilin family)
MKSADSVMDRVVMGDALSAGSGVVFEGGMVFDAEAKVDGFVAGTPAVD